MSISNLMRRIKRADSPFFAALKRLAYAVLGLHIPVFWLTRWFFRALYWLHVFGRETFILLLKFFWYEPLFRAQCENVGRDFHMEKLPYVTGTGRIVIGSGVRLSGKSEIGFNNRLSERPELIVGDDTFIAHDCSFAIAEAIRIGSHCLLAGGVSVADNDGHPLSAERRRLGEPVDADQVRPVTICDDVWIGRRATVLKGVTIGEGAVVGSNAVVTKDVGPHTVVVGNPARVVKELH